MVAISGNYVNVAQVTASDQDDPDSTPNNDNGDQSEDDEDSEEVSPNALIDLELYTPRPPEVIFVAFFLRPAALIPLFRKKRDAVAAAMPVLFALQATKIKLPKFHL